jgi:hypothetical protein
MKIAFCFLTYDEIVRYDIWNKFFHNIDNNKYTVYIHPKNIIPLNNYTFQYNIVRNRIKTIKKNDINIVKATIRLLKETYENDLDKKITHYIFLSQSCIPLYNFDIIYNVVTKLPSSLLSFINNNKKDRYYQLSNSIKKFIHPFNFIKQQPNMVLTSNDVQLLISNDLTEHFKTMDCPDEHYFVNLLHNIFKKKIIKKQINFCNPNFHRTQALEFHNINQDTIKNIRNHAFLFMRKVTKNSYIDSNFLFL